MSQWIDLCRMDNQFALIVSILSAIVKSYIIDFAQFRMQNNNCIIKITGPKKFIRNRLEILNSINHAVLVQLTISFICVNGSYFCWSAEQVNR